MSASGHGQARTSLQKSFKRISANSSPRSGRVPSTYSQVVTLGKRRADLVLGIRTLAGKRRQHAQNRLVSRHKVQDLLSELVLANFLELVVGCMEAEAIENIDERVRD